MWPAARGSPPPPARTIALAAAVVLAAIGVAVYFSRSPPIAEPPAEPAAVHSIVVLPFLDMSAEKDQGYFADGVAEEILNRLSQSSNLRVIGADVGLRASRPGPRRAADRRAPGCRLRPRGQRAQVRRSRCASRRSSSTPHQRRTSGRRPTTARWTTCSPPGRDCSGRRGRPAGDAWPATPRPAARPKRRGLRELPAWPFLLQPPFPGRHRARDSDYKQAVELDPAVRPRMGRARRRLFPIL